MTTETTGAAGAAGSTAGAAGATDPGAAGAAGAAGATGATGATGAAGADAGAAEAAAAAAAAAASAGAATPLTLPGKDAKPEDWKAFYKAIGVPETGEKYELKVPEGGDAEFAKEGANFMAELGLMPHQATKMAEWWNSKRTAAIEAFATAKTTAETNAETARLAAVATDEASLKNEWQTGYDAKIEVAKRAVRQFFPADKAPEVLTAIEKTIGYGATMRMMAKLGAGLGEGTARGIDNTQGPAAAKSIEERLYPTKAT